MLRGMRKASSNWLGKTIMAVVMGVLIISFGIWGIADIFRGFGQSTLAKVGHTEISLNQFRQLYTDRLQQISRQFGRPLTAAQAGAIDPPSPETLAAYFDDHKTQFRAPEYRKLAFVLITPEEIGKWSDVSDEDAKKLFEQRRDRLGKPEERQVSEIVFPNVEEAQAARSRIAGGLSFDDLAKERGLSSTDVDLGTVAKSAILDPEIANAAFSLPAGEVSQPVQGKFGVALVKVGAIQPGVEPSYGNAASNLKKEIATERARTKVAELRDKMEDERGGGASVIEAAQKLGLNPITVDAVDRSGRMPSGQPATNIPAGLDVVSQA